MSTDVLPRDEFSTRLRALTNNPAATELESVARQAAKLAATIDRIEEKPARKRRPRPRRIVHGTAKIASITIEREK